jgi:hypothetical protein
MKDNAFIDVSDPDALNQAAREIDGKLIQDCMTTTPASNTGSGEMPSNSTITRGHTQRKVNH